MWSLRLRGRRNKKPIGFRQWVVHYNDGYGLEEINTKLILVGKDFWLERGTYDGSEWWEYKSMPNVNDFVDGAVYIFDEEKMNAMYYSRND